MFVIIGVIVVFGAIVGGYLLEKGNLLVLLQPAELVIIGGAAVGTMLIANPPHILAKIFKGCLQTIGGSRYNRAYFIETLKLLYDVFSHIRKVGIAGIEADVDDPAKSPVFSRYPRFVSNQYVCRFVCDTLRTYLSGAVTHYELDHTMEMDIEVHHEESIKPVNALSTMADSLPGLGIVAAVLGVVITMGALGGPPEEIGHKVAAALVGTFLGILLCYGLVGPLAANMTKISEAEHQYLQCLREGIIAFIKGAAPVLAVEFARRTIPGHLRPTFQEMESACRSSGAAAGA